MNCLLNPTTDAELNKYNTSSEIDLWEDSYATAPMAAVKEATTQTLSFEEEVYSSFEQAISGRLEEVKQKLQYLSAVSPSVVHQPSKSTTISTQLSTINWRYALFFVSFAFIFTLVGFDAMGLLVLFAR